MERGGSPVGKKKKKNQLGRWSEWTTSAELSSLYESFPYLVFTKNASDGNCAG
jgi:hypothetical protein